MSNIIDIINDIKSKIKLKRDFKLLERERRRTGGEYNPNETIFKYEIDSRKDNIDNGNV